MRPTLTSSDCQKERPPTGRSDSVASGGSNRSSFRRRLCKSRKLWSSLRSLRGDLTLPACDSSMTLSIVSVETEGTVRFSNHVSLRMIPSRASTLNPSKIWYSAEERSKMRGDARATVSNFIKSHPDEVLGVSKTFRDASYLAAIMDEKDSEDFVRNTTAVSRHSRWLNGWTCYELGALRGLEDSVSAERIHHRNELARDSRVTVIDMSFRIQRRGSQIDDEPVATLYKELTRSATVAARIFGEADAFAARNAYQ